MTTTGTSTRKGTRGPDLGAIAKHPLRAACWTMIADGPKSPREISDLLGEALPKVSYHVRELRDAGVIELCREEPRRGSTEHWYSVVERPLLNDADTASRSVQERSEYAAFIHQRYFADATFAFDEGTICERHDHWIVRFPLQLDEEAWRELNEAYDALTNRIIEVQAASAQRAAKSGGEAAKAIRVTAFASYFEMPAPKKSLTVKRD